MSESMNSLYRRGAISSKQMGRMAKPAILNKTTVQASKMAHFNSKKGKRDQGGIKDRGEVPTNEINHPTNQKTGSPGSVSKGGGVHKGGQPTVDAIDQAQNPKFPGGAAVRSNKRQGGVKGPAGRPSGPQ